MLRVVTSVHGVPIRLTEERWSHILEQHPELGNYQALILETVKSPECVLEGGNGQLIAVRSITNSKWLLVVYRELKDQGVIDDGFIVTAFFNQRLRYLEGKKQAWP